MDLKMWVRDIHNFPTPGVLFRDISPLLADPVAFDLAATMIGESLDLTKFDFFIGIESRGFILASYLAAKYQKGFIPLRKAGKLPPPVIKKSYSLEYGKAELEITPGQGRVVILDDVLATGGTLSAAIELTEKAGFTIEQVAVLIDLRFLNKMTFKQKPILSVLQY